MKKILKFIIPDCIFALIYIIWGSFYSFMSAIKGVKFCNISEDRLIVIGNGPSFNRTMEEYGDIIKTTPCIVANGFVNSSFFEEIKPKYYILADPVYFQPFGGQSERIREVVNSISMNLHKKTIWPITFIFPITAIGSDLLKALEDIPTASFLYYNNRGNCSYIPVCRFKYRLWNNNIISPLSQTVLNTAISMAVKSKIRNIYLVGADTSWLETYEIDQNDNMLYTKDEHFYGVNRIPLFSNENTKEKQFLHDELENVKSVFRGYYELSLYAKFNNVKLYNASAYSWIDSLERVKLDCSSSSHE